MSSSSQIPQCDLPQDADRKLWFDYISKLNDRSLQTARESGATNWVLLAAAVAIVYRSVLWLPTLVSGLDMFKAVILVLLLEVNIALFLATSLVFLGHYTSGATERRLMPTAHLRLRQVVIVGTIVTLVALAASGLWLVTGRTIAVRWIRWVVLGCSTWWVLNAGLAVAEIIKSSRTAKKLGISVPHFAGTKAGHGWMSLLASGACSLLSLTPIAALSGYLRALSVSGADWIAALSVATHGLILLAVVIILVFRYLNRANAVAFSALERAIVVEHLTAEQIRERFVIEFLGKSIGDWLTEIRCGIRNADTTFMAVVQSVRERVPEVTSIESQYAYERQGRAKKLLDEVVTAREKRRSTVAEFDFQLKEYFRFSISAEELALLKEIATELRAWADRLKADSASTNELIDTLNNLQK